MAEHRRWQADREQVVAAIQAAAQAYKDRLVGRTFLYVFDQRFIEVLYKAQNFKHLTGVDSRLSARDFYKAALRHQLQGTQIFFTHDILTSFVSGNCSICKMLPRLRMAKVFFWKKS